MPTAGALSIQPFEVSLSVRLAVTRLVRVLESYGRFPVLLCAPSSFRSWSTTIRSKKPLQPHLSRNELETPS